MLTIFRGIDANSAYRLTQNLKTDAGFVNLCVSVDDVPEGNKSIESNRSANAAEWQTTPLLFTQVCP